MTIIKRDKPRSKPAHLVTDTPTAVVIEDGEGRLISIDPTLQDIFKLEKMSSQDFVGQPGGPVWTEISQQLSNPAAFLAWQKTARQSADLAKNEMWFVEHKRVITCDYVPVPVQADLSHVWCFHDVTEVYQSQYRWERMLAFENVSKEVNRLFFQLDDIDAALDEALAMTGQLLDVSRVYTFRIRDHERILDNTHEWCSRGVAPEIENLQGLPLDDIFPSLFPMMAEHDLIAPYHISELPEDLEGILEPQDIQTVLWVPFSRQGRIEGFIGYDETRSARSWLPEEITLARIIAKSYGHALEREQNTRMLIEARDEAIRMSQLRVQFVANMSHEIRTPLTGILGMIELLQETDLDEMQIEFATQALQSSNNLLTIINDILDFSKLQAGQVVLEANKISLREILTEVKMTLDPQVKNKDINIVLETDERLPHRVHGDATRIRQVLMNLAGNAVKFTEAGQVTLSVNVLKETDKNVQLHFSVQDTGIGITKDSIEHIFQSFVQADGSTTRKYGGSGLGLSITTQLVALMGGKVDVQSEPGVGSTFAFDLTLPVAQASGRQNADATIFDGMQVLLFDENRTTSYVFTQKLESWGVQVTQVYETDELEAAGASDYDLLFIRRPTGSEALLSDHILTRYANRTIYVVDPNLMLKEDSRHLHFPIDQSSLYNVLVSAVHEPAELPEIAQSQRNVLGRVLLADDNPVNSDLVKRALAGTHIQVVCVEDGHEVLAELEQTSFDLILMDIQMQVMNGVETTTRIRQADKPYCKIPILALTASVMREEQDHYFSIGVNEIISKPFSLKQLRQTVERWLSPEAKPPL